MIEFLIAVPLVVMLVTVIYGIAGSLLRIWLDHRVQLALLEKIEKNPGMLPPFQEVQSFLGSGATSTAAKRGQDYTLTGLLLTAIGVVCVVAGRTIGVGEVAVGMHLGGLINVGLGLLLTVMGILIRVMRKSTLTPVSKEG